MDMFKFFEMKSRGFIIFVSFMLALLIGVLDLYAGPRVFFMVFYLIPIFIAAWFGKKPETIIISLFAGSMWYFSDKVLGPEKYRSLINIWNTFTVIFSYVFISLLLYRLKIELKKARRAARIDFLTGLVNIREFHARCFGEMERMSRSRKSLTIAYIDVDDFKRINDRLGHDKGDVVLRKAASVLMKNVRKTDTAARLGGDEFAVLFPALGPAGVKKRIKKIKKKLRKKMENHSHKITFSFGVITYTKPPKTVRQMIRQADRMMYKVKKSGKNRFRHKVIKKKAKRRK